VGVCTTIPSEEVLTFIADCATTEGPADGTVFLF